VGKPASIGDGVSHRGELMAASFAQKRGRCRKPARSISARPCPLIEAIAAVTAMSAAHALTTAVPGRIDACGQSLSAVGHEDRATPGLDAIRSFAPDRGRAGLSVLRDCVDLRSLRRGS
jgi:hypothetical protein